MLVRLSIMGAFAAILMLPTTLSAQVDPGGAINPGGATCAAKVSGLTFNGTPMVATDTFRVTMNNFLATGGDGFTVFLEGTNPLGGAIDLDAFADYVTSKEPAGVVVPTLNRIVAIP